MTMRLGDIRLDELIAADPRAVGFGPLGLGGALPVEVALEHQRATVARFPLAPNVGEQTRRAIERLQLTHLYGLLCYEMFSVAERQVWLALDLALAERFLEFYAGVAPFVVGGG